MARSGRPFGLGTEAQAREEADGLNSARAVIPTEREVIVAVVIVVCGAVQHRWRGRRKTSDYCTESRQGWPRSDKD